MTLDKAIAHEKELAEENYMQGMLCHANPNDDELDGYIENGRYHEQVAKWLEDYKHIKQWKSDIMEDFCKYDVDSFEELVTNTRNKAIDDFVKWLENKKYLMKEIQDHDFCYTHYDELKASCVTTEYFAEQLKVGGVND